MNERPIEKIIGWTYVLGAGAWCVPGEHNRIHTHAEVDDLAAWLLARRLFPVPRYEQHLDVWRVYLNTLSGTSWFTAEYDGPSFDGRTILAALTAAVRKVAES